MCVCGGFGSTLEQWKNPGFLGRIYYEIILPSYVVIILSTIPKTLVENNHIKCQDSMELCLDNTKTIVRYFPGSNPFRKGYLWTVLNS